jgi:hypothetical protein
VRLGLDLRAEFAVGVAVAAAAISEMAFVIRLGRRGHVRSRVAMESWRCYIGAVLAWDTLVGVSVGALRALAVPMLGLWLLAGGAARF